MKFKVGDRIKRKRDGVGAWANTATVVRIEWTDTAWDNSDLMHIRYDGETHLRTALVSIWEHLDVVTILANIEP